VEVVNNKKEFRFEIALPDGEFAILTYRWLKGSIVLMHTFVPVAARGKGIANILVEYVLEHIRSHHLKMIVYCPFVTEYLKKHPEYQPLNP
jgi:predicted GNAT family acetyltransferase